MSLTAGATLQNHKYAIHKQLHQSDFGVTYQAQHSILGRPVVLQTLNDTLQQRDDFGQLRQQFLNRVRMISQQPVSNLHVLDCFEEDGLPFVVFELAPDQPLPQFSDWIPVTPLSEPALVAPELAVGQAVAFEAQAETGAESVKSGQVATAVGSRMPEARMPEARMPEPKVPITSTHSTAMTAATAQPRHAWMPMALIFASMLGGLSGVGLGFFWRFSSAQANGRTHSSPKSAQNLTPHLFSREQSFPSGADWPILEIPQIFTPAPAPAEAPYRSSTEEYLPPYRPLPEVSLPAAPPPVQPVQPVSPEPSLIPPPSLAPILPRQVGNAPLPAQIVPPVETAPEPPPPAPPPAAIDSPPPKLPKVFQN